jgi:uncharacterized protein (TIGR03083 family)
MSESGSSPWTTDLEAFDLAEHYKLTRERITAVVGEIEETTTVSVPACPGWTVHDVVAHLTAVVEDALAGKLTGPPSEEMTAEQVTRFREVPMAEMLEQWTDTAPQFEEGLQALRIWPGFLDVLAHEHDIRGAIGRPGERDSYEMVASSEALMSFWEPPLRLRVKAGENEYVLGDGEDDLGLETCAYEIFRFRLGRRSVSQLRSMSWSGDPGPILEHLVLFGPEPYDVVE